MDLVKFIGIGIVTGILAGFFGVGGGIILIPLMIWLFHTSQHEAQAISLTAMLLPVGIFGVIAYYRANPFPLKPPFYIALGMFLGTFIGATLVQKLPDKSLKMAFGVLLIIAGIKLLLGK